MAKKSGSSKNKKGSNNRKDRMSRKKSEEEFKKAETEKKVIKGAIAFFIIVVIIALAVRIASPPPGGETDYSSPYEIIGNELVIPISDVSTSASFYSYDSNGKDVKFFVVRGSDGDIHTAFDACDVCFKEKKGYYQDGNKMVCRNCGQRFTTNEIGTANTGTGCWPGNIIRTVDNSYVRIKLSELDRGRAIYFP
ncbi:MAG: DUF2318 domain-containing protein [Thermoplasmata archaeon]|nr:MAG: DUF2318 domain-containing protein [Thermoplasmata archaeon]